MKSLVFPRIFLHCVALGFIVSGLLLSGRSEVRIPSGVPKERDIRKDVPFLWPPAAGNGCLPGNFKYPRADAVCASIRVISGRRR